MPVHRGKNYYQYGKSGKKYYYVANNTKSKLNAKKKAYKQERAIHASGYRE